MPVDRTIDASTLKTAGLHHNGWLGGFGDPGLVPGDVGELADPVGAAVGVGWELAEGVADEGVFAIPCAPAVQEVADSPGELSFQPVGPLSQAETMKLARASADGEQVVAGASRYSRQRGLQ